MRDLAYLYAFEGMADWEYGYLAAELNSGRYFSAAGSRLEVRTLALGPGPVRTMGGLRILPDEVLAGLDESRCALLILPGGDSWLEGARHGPAIDLARRLLEAGVPVAAICGATFGLAAAGLLDERAHTSNDLGFLESVCPAYRGAARYSSEPAAADGDLITATGLAPVEFAHRALARLGAMDEASLEAWLALNTRRGVDDYYRLQGSVARARGAGLTEGSLRGGGER